MAEGARNFSSDPTRPVTDIKRAWGTVRAKSAVKCRFHDLRHTVATGMAEAGVPESTMLAILGHVRRAMLERYSRATGLLPNNGGQPPNPGLIKQSWEERFDRTGSGIGTARLRDYIH
jgi:integrase